MIITCEERSSWSSLTAPASGCNSFDRTGGGAGEVSDVSAPAGLLPLFLRGASHSQHTSQDPCLAGAADIPRVQPKKRWQAPNEKHSSWTLFPHKVSLSCARTNARFVPSIPHLNSIAERISGVMLPVSKTNRQWDSVPSLSLFLSRSLSYLCACTKCYVDRHKHTSICVFIRSQFFSRSTS